MVKSFQNFASVSPLLIEVIILKELQNSKYLLSFVKQFTEIFSGVCYYFNTRKGVCIAKINANLKIYYKEEKV